MLLVDEDGRTIKIHRGDEGTLSYSVPVSDTENYQFEVGDKIELVVFEKKGYTKETIFSREVIVTEATEIVDIQILKEDTEKIDKANKPIVCWYDIYLNGNLTNGYDEEEGAAEFRVLPAKGDD